MSANGGSLTLKLLERICDEADRRVSCLLNGKAKAAPTTQIVHLCHAERT